MKNTNILKYIRFAVIAIIGITIDQIVKAWAYNELRPVGSIPLIQDVFHFTYRENTGAAFSFLEGNNDTIYRNHFCRLRKKPKIIRHISKSNINDKYIHTHPIIRKEYPYNNLTIDERRKILNKMLRFTMGCPIKYFNIVVNKREFKNKHSLSANIAKQLSKFTDMYSEYLHQFERIIVYYDNGQNELSYILNVILNAKLSLVEFKNASPISYQLLQVADFLCTMELLKQKHKNNLLTISEKTFFYKPQERLFTESTTTSPTRLRTLTTLPRSRRMRMHSRLTTMIRAMLTRPL